MDCNKKKLQILMVFSLLFFLGIQISSAQNNQIDDKNTIRVDVDKNSIIAFNSKGSVLWTRTFDSDINTYKLDDLDNDGLFETVIGTNGEEYQNSTIYAFDYKGENIWQYRIGIDCDEVYGKSTSFAIIQIITDDINNDNFKEILVNARATLFYPSELLLFDHNGKLIGKYWHPGYIIDVKISDFFNKGHKEIIGGGINNDAEKDGSNRHAILFVLDPDNMNGQGYPYYGNYRKIHEKYYLVLPQSDVQTHSSCITKIYFDKKYLIAEIDDGRLLIADDSMNYVIGASDQYKDKIEELSKKKWENVLNNYITPLFYTVFGAIFGIIIDRYGFRVMKKN